MATITVLAKECLWKTVKSQKENNKVVDHEIQISKNEDIMYSYESSQIELKNTKPTDRRLSKFLSENYQSSTISLPISAKPTHC